MNDRNRNGDLNKKKVHYLCETLWYFPSIFIPKNIVDRTGIALSVQHLSDKFILMYRTDNPVTQKGGKDLCINFWLEKKIYGKVIVYLYKKFCINEFCQPAEKSPKFNFQECIR